MKRLFVAVLFLAAFAAEHAWPQPRTKLNVVYPAISGINAALWFAAETRIFEKHGLEVKLIYIPTALQLGDMPEGELLQRLLGGHSTFPARQSHGEENHPAVHAGRRR